MPEKNTAGETGTSVSIEQSGFDSLDSPSLAFLREVAQTPYTSRFELDLALPSHEGAASDRRFAVRQRMGAGGFGVVYEAFDRIRNATVALKALRRRDGASVSLFKREFRALAEVRHTNLVQLYELHVEDDEWFFTMELVRGVHALAYVRPSGGPADLQRLRSVFHQLTMGLCFLHRAGKLHRDVKPSNVLVAEDGRVVLVDFGLVREIADLDAGSVVGTPAYMAPEQAEGKPVGEAADWYAVGVMLYQALKGSLPSRDDSPADAQASTTLAGVPEDLDRLCRDLLAVRPERRPSGGEVLARFAYTPPVRPGEDGAGDPFVGRAAQLAALRLALTATDRGAVTLALLPGRSGMGKSVLLRRFLDGVRAEDPDRLVLLGRCFEQESVPYKGIDGLLDDLCERLRDRMRAGRVTPLPTHAASLARVFPQLGEVLGLRAEVRGSAEAGPLLRAQAFVALRELLSQAGSGAPVLAVDDLQWGDLDSIAVLAAILNDRGRMPLLLVTAFREEDAETNPVLQAFFAAFGAAEGMEPHRVEVGKLHDDEAAALSRSLLGADPSFRGGIAEETVGALVAEAQGNPFLLSELLRHGALPAPNGRAGAPRLELGMLLALRIGRLPEPARRLLEVIAVEGQPLPRAVAEQAAYGAERASDALGAISVLRAERLIRSRHIDGAEELLPYHDRIREVVARNLDPDTRRAHHYQLALASEALGAAEPERLLFHYRGAGRRDDAARHAAAAALRAREALAFDRAARLYREALELRESSGPDAEDRRLRIALAEALASAGRPAEAAGAYLEAARGAAPRETQPWRQRAAQLLLGAGHVDEGIATLRDVLGNVGIPFAPSVVRSVLTLAWLRLRLGIRGLGFRERAESAVPEKQILRIDACYAAAQGLFLVNPILGAGFQARHLLLALQAGEPSRVARALASEAVVVAVARGSGPLADRLLASAREIERRVALPRLSGVIRFCEANVAQAGSRWRHGHELLVESESVLRRHCPDASTDIDLARFQRANFVWMLGEVEEFRRLVPFLIEEARERGNRQLEMMVRLSNEPTLALLDGRPDRAREAIAIALDRWPRPRGSILHVRETSARARIFLYEGRADLALATVDEGLSAIRRTGVRFVRSQMADLRVWRGVAALSLGDLGRVRSESRALARLPFFWAQGSAILLNAGLAHLTGDRQGALALLGTARTRARANETLLWAAAVSRRIGEWAGDSAEVAAADSWMTARGIVEPARVTGMLLGVLGRG